MTLIQEKENKLITVEELFNMELEEGYFYELLNGHIVKKQAPTPMHQKAVVKITTLIENFITERDLGDCYTSPIDVFFDKYNNTQPDILFIKKERLFIVTKDGIQGQPDLIVEVLSPSTYRTDRIAKMKTHCQFGVSEYWIVDPIYKLIEVYSLENNAYVMTSNAIETGEITSKTLDGLKIDMGKIFDYVI
jgi:Uma2 family endonuclease